MTSINATSIPQPIAEALNTASERTGAGFDYLLRTAVRESGLNPAAKAPSSSATGLFQFIEQTWFETVKEAGPRNGLAAFADDITLGSSGRYEVADPDARREILALRRDPLLAAIMAGELTAANREELASALGRAPSDGELYIGHFLGAGGAARLISTAASEPDASAAELFPTAARANRSIFYDNAGQERGARDVYARLVRQHERGTPANFNTDRRESVTPFAGIVALFERLFSGISEPERAAAPALSYAPAPPPRADSAYTMGGQMARGGDGTDDGAGGLPAEAALAGRIASDAYAAQALAGGWARADLATDRAGREPGNEPWAGGLFTNMQRPAGPLSFIGPRPTP